MTVTKPVLNKILKEHGLSNIRQKVPSANGFYNMSTAYRTDGKLTKAILIDHIGPMSPSYRKKMDEMIAKISIDFSNAGMEQIAGPVPTFQTLESAKKQVVLELHTVITPSYSEECNMDRSYNTVSIIPCYRTAVGRHFHSSVL